MPIRITYLKRGVEGVSRILGDAKILPGAETVNIVSSQQAWDILKSELAGTLISKLALDEIEGSNIANDGCRISLKNEDGSTPISEYIFENPLSFQAFNLLVTNSNSVKIETQRRTRAATMAKDRQTEWKWSGNAK